MRDPSILEAAAVIAALGSSDHEDIRNLLGNVDAYLSKRHPTQIRLAAISVSNNTTMLLELARTDSETAVRSHSAWRAQELEPQTEDLTTLLSAADPVVVAIAADALAERPDPQAQTPLISVLSSAAYNNDADIDMLRAVLEALGHLYEGPGPIVRQPPNELYEPLNGALHHRDALVRKAASDVAKSLAIPIPEDSTTPQINASTLFSARVARVRTSTGEVLMHLYPEEAPLTVWNFMNLAESGYFDGLTIHRVVPDFVVQDGDPRGDGSGGPNWSIPDEINPLHYREGTVGMALAGPDTGGSQWFVTLSPQPHLDGNYTIFGQVYRGMSALKDLQPGDRIEQIVIEHHPESADTP